MLTLDESHKGPSWGYTLGLVVSLARRSDRYIDGRQPSALVYWFIGSHSLEHIDHMLELAWDVLNQVLATTRMRSLP